MGPLEGEEQAEGEAPLNGLPDEQPDVEGAAGDVHVVEGGAQDLVADDVPVVEPAAAEGAEAKEPSTTSLTESSELADLPPTPDGIPSAYALVGLLVLVLLVGVGWRTLSRPRGAAIGATGEAEPEALPSTASADESPLAESTPHAEPEDLVARFSSALARSRAALQGRFDTLFGRDTIDEALFEELEEVLLKADVGLPTTERLLEPLRSLAKDGAEPAALRGHLREAIRALLLEQDPQLSAGPPEGPLVLLVVGVNGSGKTTTIGKLAAKYEREGKNVLLAAADTYRAAAADQLKVWAERAEVDIVAHDEGSDPGAVVYDALDAALARRKDVVIVDTAGRLQTARPLMEQLGKIRRVIDKKVPGAPHETLLVLDGTMGQNGLSQAKLFDQATPLTGAVVTKLDGTARGGMVLTLASELELPVKFIGIGEGIDDLKAFDAAAFAEALA